MNTQPVGTSATCCAMYGNGIETYENGSSELATHSFVIECSGYEQKVTICRRRHLPAQPGVAVKCEKGKKDILIKY